MIPKLNQSGVLPPFINEHDPADAQGMSPYKATIKELVLRYGYSPERKLILKGLLDYRERLRTLGIREGFQWVDGSFVEDVEAIRGRPPNDVDIVTFATRPNTLREFAQWKQAVSTNEDLFHPEVSKQVFTCDAYYVDLGLAPTYLVDRTRYWFGLFSHQRESYLWKGLIEIPIDSDDTEARHILEQEV